MSAAGFANYLTKPVDIVELTDIVNRLLEENEFKGELRLTA